MPAKYVLKATVSGDYMFNLHAGNGQVILTSPQLPSKAEAEERLAAARTHSGLDDRFVRLTASSGEPFFRLEAADGTLLGYSELYATAAARDDGITSVIANGPQAPTEVCDGS